MILNILNYPNPILRKKSEEILEITPEIRRLASDMKEAMIKNNGVGLAAPQVGELKRIIVVQTAESPKVFINPEIVKKTKEAEIMEEGCLCLPGLFLNIKRSKGVKLQALDENGNEVGMEAVGMTARIIQHEVDHLNGVLFIDKISFWEKLKYFLNFRKRKFLR